MLYVYTFLTGLLIGALAGLLVYRKHADKLKAEEARLKDFLIDGKTK